MHLKNFPKRLDSKTSCLRITVPENLDLALEGLIRKVLREQPKTDCIHSFAADYFETLLKIRDKAGAKYSSAQLCPFHNDEDAHEMIKLANTFSKPLRKSSKEPPPTKGVEVDSGKCAENRVQSRGTGRPKGKERLKKERKQTVVSKQATPDLIKKLPGNLPEGKKEEEGAEDEEESITGDPIKELVEKELNMEALAQKTETHPREVQEQSAQEETRRGQGEANGAKEEANVREGNKEVAREGDEEVADEVDKEIAGERDKGVAEEGDKELAREGNQEIARDGDKEVAREGDKEIAREGDKGVAREENQEIAREGDKEIVRDGDKEVPREGDKEIALEGGKGVAEEGDQETVETREENTKDLVKESDGKSEATEEAKEETGAEEPSNKDRTDETEETTNGRTTDPKVTEPTSGHQIPVEISGPEKETDMKKHDTDEPTAAKVETKTPTEVEVSSALIVDDKLPTAAKDRDREATDVKSTNDVPPDTMNLETVNDDSGTEIVSKEAKGEEDKPVDNLPQPITGSDGTEPQPEGDMRLLEEKSHPIPEDEAEETVAEMQEKRDTGTKTIEEITIDAVVEETQKTTSSLSEDTSEHKMNAENVDERTSEPEQKKPENEEKPPTEEERFADSPEKNENAKTAKESETSDGGTVNKENAEVKDVPPVPEKVPGEQEQPNPVKPDEDNKANSSDQPKQLEKGVESKGDTTTTEQKLLEEHQEEAAEEKENKSEAKAQPLSQGDVGSEAALPSTNATAEPEKAEELPDIKAAEPKPQDSKPDLKEIQNEETGDELCTVVDIQQIPPEGTGATQKKEDPKEPEEELRTPADGQHTIRIEEPEVAKDDLGVPQSPEEVQIKTIQTHYYDTLQVPETVTKELRVHNVSDALSIAPLLAGPATAGATGDAEDDNANAQVAGHSESAQMDGSSPAEISTEAAPDQQSDSAEKPQPSERPNDVPLLVGAPNQHDLGSDTRRSETDDLLDLMTPTSGYSVNLSELSWQTVSGIFLDSERQHSSRLSEELRYATPAKSSENINEPESHESAEGRPEIAEVFHKTVLPTLVGAVPMPPRDAEEAEKEESAGIPENAAEKGENKPGVESFGGSSNGKSFDSDTPFISVEVKTVIETQILDDDDDEGEGRPRVELKVEATVDVEDAEVKKTRREAEGSPEGEEKEMSDGQPKAADSSGEGTAAREGSSGESYSTASSAATEIKRSDSGRRAAGGGSSLLASQSLDLGGRNPLLRTRSLSTFRHGVTDFEIWSAIEKELEEAATKIQTRFRSYKARKKLQRENAVQITTEESSPSTTPAETDERQQSTGEFHDSIVLSDHPR